MPDSNEIRRLSAKWATGSGWPQRLEWVEVTGVRGWTGQRFHLRYPIMAVVGENGVGKSSVLQAVASVYRSPKNKKARFASDFFPDTAWERITNAIIGLAIASVAGFIYFAPLTYGLPLSPKAYDARVWLRNWR